MVQSIDELSGIGADPGDDLPEEAQFESSEWHKGYRSGWQRAYQRFDRQTFGNWKTEKESAAEFDRLIGRHSRLLRVYSEVRGTLVQPRPGQVDKGMRIDRVLVPTQGLIAAYGWDQGIIGVELKRSGEKLGKPIAQATDYLRTAWRLPSGGFSVMLQWVFIWPMPSDIGGPVASFCAQQRIGSASTAWDGSLELKCGQRLLRLTIDGMAEVGHPTNGRQAGSR